MWANTNLPTKYNVWTGVYYGVKGQLFMKKQRKSQYKVIFFLSFRSKTLDLAKIYIFYSF